MRSILAITFLLLGMGLVSCNIEGRSADLAHATQSADWVRTVDGWEHPGNWSPSFHSPPAIHPLVIAAGQTLVSLLALAIASTAAGPTRDAR
jgi:hypothetical protein